MIELYIIFGLFVLLAFYAISVYNKLVKYRQHNEEAWSDISVQMKRRYNLIPNLVETVKGYASHEKDTLEAVISARSAAALNDGSIADQSASENILSGALRQLFALSEAYPDLKANTSFQKLQNELSEIEDHIQKSRRFYNGNVRVFNVAVESFPSNIIANMFGFVKAQFFELEEAEADQVKQAPKVEF
jgi:LemA protein